MTRSESEYVLKKHTSMAVLSCLSVRRQLSWLDKVVDAGQFVSWKENDVTSCAPTQLCLDDVASAASKGPMMAKRSD